MLFVLLVLAYFWLNGSVPELVAKTASIRYVKDNYGYMDFVFHKVEFSSSHGNYFAYFIDKDGNEHAFMLLGKLWPSQVWYDPLDPPGP